MGAKITRLPDKINPYVITRDKILEKYRTCPFCGEKRRWLFDGKDEGVSYCLLDVGYRPLKKFHFWEKHYSFGAFFFTCHTCGAKWRSEEFP